MEAFTRLTCWFLPRKNQQSPNPSSSQTLSPNSPIGFHNPRTRIHYSPRRANKNRERTSIDKEYNIVLVPSDGECVSESDSDESDWSIGWFEPHGTDFDLEKDMNDSSFAVLVPCYRTGTVHREERLIGGIVGTEDILRNASEGRNYIEQWLSSLQSPDLNNEFELEGTSIL